MGTIESTPCAEPECDETAFGFDAAAEAPDGRRWYCLEHRAAPDRPNARAR